MGNVTLPQQNIYICTHFMQFHQTMIFIVEETTSVTV